MRGLAFDANSIILLHKFLTTDLGLSETTNSQQSC